MSFGMVWVALGLLWDHLGGNVGIALASFWEDAVGNEFG